MGGHIRADEARRLADALDEEADSYGLLAGRAFGEPRAETLLEKGGLCRAAATMLREQTERLDTLTDPELAERLDAALRQWGRVGGFAPAVLGDLRRVVDAMKGAR